MRLLSLLQIVGICGRRLCEWHLCIIAGFDRVIPCLRSLGLHFKLIQNVEIPNEGDVTDGQRSSLVTKATTLNHKI
jgi:hypothetical protein